MLVKSASQQINVSGEGLVIDKGPYTLPSWGHWPPLDQPQASGWSSSISRAVRVSSSCCLLPIQWRKRTENKEIYFNDPMKILSNSEEQNSENSHFRGLEVSTMCPVNHHSRSEQEAKRSGDTTLIKDYCNFSSWNWDIYSRKGE